MTTRRDVDLLTAASRGVVALARRDLELFFGSLSLTSPEAVRDALLGFVPELVRTYGDVAATVAAEWYEDVRAASIGGAFNAQLADVIPVSQAQGSVRYAAGHLFTDDPTMTLAVVSGAIQRFILYSSRATVARNAEHDPLKPRFGRVPTGAKTCAFCSMMASRGFVYYTRATAGEFDHFHDDCDCQIVAEWDREQHHIAGYDPDHLYGLYLSARDAAGSDPNDILAEMRRMFPDQFTDGVVTP